MLQVFSQTARQIGRTMAILALGAGAFHYLVLLSSSAFLGEGEELLENAPRFFTQPPKAIEAFLGGEVNFFEPTGWVASAMTHPVVLAILVGAVLSVAAGAISAEVERGTIDLVLARPVGRARFLLGKAAAMVVGLSLVELGALAGVLVATVTVDRIDEIALADLWRPFVMSWLLFLALGMVTLFLSARSSLRSRTVGAAVGLIVAWYFVNFIAALIDEVSGARYASPFHYFRPPELLRGEPIGLEAGVLGGLAALALAAALWWFRRRDLTR